MNMWWMTVLLAAVLTAAAARLALYRRQLEQLAEQLEQTPASSCQRLTCSFRAAPLLRLCRAVNRRMDAWQQEEQNARQAQEELKYTISCVSHDIRTPLTGAAGYVQLLEETRDAGKRQEYCRIIRGRLDDLEGLLDQLFLYTRLSSADCVLECGPCPAYPAVCEALAGFFQAFEEKGWQPTLDFQQEDCRVWAEPQALRRIFRNLTANALQHGAGPLDVRQRGRKILFSNEVACPENLRPERLFERFYRQDTARGTGNAGLGLAVVRELMERMGGHVSARVEAGRLWIVLEFARQGEETEDA